MSRIFTAALLLAVLFVVGCSKEGGAKDGSTIDPKIADGVPKDKEVKPIGNGPPPPSGRAPNAEPTPVKAPSVKPD